MGMYTVSFENVTVSAAQDLFEIAPADDQPVVIHSIRLANVGPDVGDAAEEMLRVSVIRGHTTSGSGGSAATAHPTTPFGGTAALAAEVNNTTIATVGTGVTLDAFGFNVRVGIDRVYTPEERLAGSQASLLVVRLLAGPADPLSLSGTLWIAEF